jgi:hypothetical protein
MAKINIKHNPKVRQIFEDLEKYKEFCVDYGYVFDEAHLYDMKQFSYRQHTKQLSGKQPKNNWIEDSKGN